VTIYKPGISSVTRASTPEEALRAAAALYRQAAKDATDKDFWRICELEVKAALALLAVWEEPAAIDRMRQAGLGWIADAIESRDFARFGDW
jgi:hypothetical protein